MGALLPGQLWVVELCNCGYPFSAVKVDCSATIFEHCDILVDGRTKSTDKGTTCAYLHPFLLENQLWQILKLAPHQ
jgi:hypothetical protein